MEQPHVHEIVRAFTSQAASFNASAVANAAELLETLVHRANAGRGERWFDAACGPGVVSFDGAVTRFSIHHIPVPSRLIDELARVVRPGGTIVILDHVADSEADARSWAQEVERLRDPSHWACLSDSQLRALGHNAGLSLVQEQCFSFELDFDDWLHRGTDSEAARELVELSLAIRTQRSECFYVSSGPTGRVLRLHMWLSVWRR